MNTETSTIPIYVRLFERQGAATEALVNKIQQLAATAGILDDVSLEQVLPREDNSSQNRIVYAVHTKPSRQRHSASVGGFLDQLFSQFFENHTSFVEPLTYVPDPAKR